MHFEARVTSKATINLTRLDCQVDCLARGGTMAARRAALSEPPEDDPTRAEKGACCTKSPSRRHVHPWRERRHCGPLTQVARSCRSGRLTSGAVAPPAGGSARRRRWRGRGEPRRARRRRARCDGRADTAGEASEAEVTLHQPRPVVRVLGAVGEDRARGCGHDWLCEHAPARVVEQPHSKRTQSGRVALRLRGGQHVSPEGEDHLHLRMLRSAVPQVGRAQARERRALFEREVRVAQSDQAHLLVGAL
mmetsp:Transcript_47402/g.109005  ORF Transcript_47402/g.109005 Transcript_47402/m.109005 type:complete len:249 (+) Transcript_47402:104-850(+)